MKNKSRFWYLGYLIALLLVLLIALTDFAYEVDLALGVIFSSVFAVSHIKLVHNKMLKNDKDYKISISDERFITIKEKAGNATNMINTLLMGIVTVLFIAMNYIVPAIIVGVIILVQPIILIVVSNTIEKKI